MIGLIDRGIVYTPDPTTGEYSVVDNPALPCRLTIVTVVGESSGPNRTELIDERRLLWGNQYVMPEIAQVEINSKRWNCEAGSFADVRGPSGIVQYRRCKVVRAL